MAKKGKKHELAPVLPSATISALPSTISTPPATILAPVLPLPSSPAAEPTTMSYKPITDDISVERLVGLAKDSPCDSALGIVWRHAFEAGKTLGYTEGTKLFEGADISEIMKTAVEQGIEIGRNREKRAWGAAGHSTICITVARPPRGVAVQTKNIPPRSTAMLKVDPFQAGYNEGRRDEEGDWIIEGHGQHCGFQPTAVREDSTIQTDNPPPHSIATTAIQTDTPKPQVTIPPAFRTTNIPDIIPFVIQNTSSQMSPHPEPTPNPTRITSPPSPPLNWADDAASLPISSLPILSSRSAPRNLSVLRSLTPKPFSSLQHRNKRSQAHHS